MTAAEVGFTVTHRRYVKHGDAHYGGGLVDGAYVLGLFGDVATEASVLMDGDEGLLASYRDVQFRAPVQAGDTVEATCVVTRVGTRSRELSFEARVTCRADPGRGPSAAAALAEPLVVVTATGTVVIPAALRRCGLWRVAAATAGVRRPAAAGQGVWGIGVYPPVKLRRGGRSGGSPGARGPGRAGARARRAGGGAGGQLDLVGPAV